MANNGSFPPLSFNSLQINSRVVVIVMVLNMVLNELKSDQF
jgi:hypothetical protein